MNTELNMRTNLSIMRTFIPLEHAPISNFHLLRMVQDHLLISQGLRSPWKEHDEGFLQEEYGNDPNRQACQILTQM